MKFYAGLRNALAISIALWLLISVGERSVHAQLNCSGGPLNCPGTPTGTGIAVLQTAPTLNGTVGIAGGISFASGGATIANPSLQNNSDGLLLVGGVTNGVRGATADVMTQLWQVGNAGNWGILKFPTANAFDVAGTIAGTSVISGATSTVTITTANLQFRGNAVLKDGTPTCSGGGCVVLANSINSAGSVSTTTTGAADVTITFSASFQHAPVCLGDNATTGNLLRATQEAVGSFHLQGVTASGDNLGYVCIGN